MKYKLVCTILISVIMIGGGIGELIYINWVFDELNEQLDAIAAQGEEYSLDSVYETKEWLSKKHGRLEFFMPHYQLNEISVTYGEFTGAVEAEDYVSARAQLTRLKENADRLSDMYSFKLSNIF